VTPAATAGVADERHHVRLRSRRAVVDGGHAHAAERPCAETLQPLHATPASCMRGTTTGAGAAAMCG
jgi:hypothetical protein